MFPALMAGDRFTLAARVAVGLVLVLPLAALVALSSRRPLSVLDLWLMVAMFAWFGEVFAGSLMSSGRFDVGWYVGRAYGVISSTAVLIILLSETIALYARSARVAENERPTASANEGNGSDSHSSLASDRNWARTSLPSFTR